jgi:hypothetical protein
VNVIECAYQSLRHNRPVQVSNSVSPLLESQEPSSTILPVPTPRETLH